MDKIVDMIIKKYGLPRPISESEAIGKKVKQITTGCWINENTYVIFEDNTCISFGERWFGDSHEDYVLEPETYGADYIADMGYADTSKFHIAYEEYHTLYEKRHEKQMEEIEHQKYLQLKKKYEK